LIDDAIVMVETIVREIHDGSTPLQAALAGGRKLGFAVIATSVSLCAVFIPVAFTTGLVGQFFFEFGMTVTFAILISTVGALTLTPMLCSIFLKPHASTAAKARMSIMPWVERTFDGMVRWAIRRRGPVIAAAFLVFVGSLSLTKWVGKEFVPTPDESEFNVQLQFPTGTPLEVSAGVLDRLQRRLREVEEIDHVLATIGGGGGERIDVASLSVDLVPKDRRDRGQLAVMADVRDRFADLQNIDISVESVPRVSGGGFRSAPINLDIRGPRLKKLEEITDRIVNAMGDMPGIVDVNTSYKAGKPRLEVKVDHNVAGVLGVRLGDLGEAVRLFVGGDDVVTYEEDGDLHDVVVRLNQAEQRDRLMIGEIPIRSEAGVIPLVSVSQLIEGTGPVQIDHQGQQRQITILANVTGDKPLQSAVEDIERFLTDEDFLPPGYTYGFSGFADLMQESFTAMAVSVVLAIAIIYMTLASQFNSFIHPLTIMITLPLSVIGAFGGLLMTGMTLNIFSMIGLILLAGLVTKTGILVVEFANQLRDEGVPLDHAISQAAKLRLRPIIMTTLSTIGASLPVAIGLGQGSEQRAPQAVVIIGGLVSSTLLTLLVLPAVYRVLSHFERSDRSAIQSESLVGDPA
jgi:HAE1 family hydrophobic/amphiphilic exporter-1